MLVYSTLVQNILYLPWQFTLVSRLYIYDKSLGSRSCAGYICIALWNRAQQVVLGPVIILFLPRMIWRNGLIEKWTLGAEWMFRKNGWSSGSHHTKPPSSQTGCSSNNVSSNYLSCIQVCPPNGSKDLYLLLYINPSMFPVHGSFCVSNLCDKKKKT